MNAVSQLLKRLNTGQPLTGDDFIALLLIITMAASVFHLLTMLVTRWGDRHTALKSLVASVLIHGVCLLGLEVFDPLTERKMATAMEVVKKSEVITQILVESDQDIPMATSGNVPVADRMLRPETELSRFEVPSREITRPELPEPDQDQLESLNTTAEDVNQFEQRNMTELSMASDSGVRGPRQAAVEDPFADIQTTFDRNSADIPALQQSRTRPKPGSSDLQSREPLPMEPQATAPELRFQPVPETIAMRAGEAGENSILLPEVTTEQADRIERQTAPKTSPESVSNAGLAMNVPEPKAGPSASFQPRLPRPSRALPDRVPAPQPSRESPLIARTPIPLASDYEDVRIGLIAPDFSESVTSATSLVEADLPTIRRRDNPPATYQLRNVEQRRETAQKLGGTQQSESAVEVSLRWLSAMQSADGRWDAEDHGAGQVKVDENGVDRNYAGREADSGVTALVMLSFLGAGYTHENGRYAFVVDNALDWLIRQQAPDGNLYGKAEHFARMYCHGMATYALAEAYGMQKQTLLGPIVNPELLVQPGITASRAAAAFQQACIPFPLHLIRAEESLQHVVSERLGYSLRKVDDLRLRSALARAVTFTIGQQDPRSGGWRYKFGQEGDVSMFGWQMMSLKSAEIAGLTLDERVRQRMNSFLNGVRQGKSGGLFGYRRNTKVNGRDSEKVTPVMTAEALFCQQMLGYPRESDANRESVAYLLQNSPRLSELNYYYWYYGTLAMYQYGGKEWEDWNVVVRDTLISQQRTDGELAGSWDPNDPWGRYGGRLYSTALATLTLEVYYRLLPLYRMNQEPASKGR